MGGHYALDLGAIAGVFAAIGITPDRVEWEMVKMVQIFDAINDHKKQKSNC